MVNTQPRSPFDVPELRAIISAHLTKNDALACSRVCWPWSMYFRGLVWHTVNFAKIDPSKLTLAAVVNHGHHIRAVQNLRSSTHINTLMWNYKRLNLTSLSVVLSAEPLFQTDLNDFLRLVRSTLTELDLSVEPPKTRINVPVDVILAREPSRLTKISIRGLQLSRLSLIELLQGCSDLQDLSLHDVLIPSQGIFTDWAYKHPNLRHLSASFKDIVPIPVDPRLPPSPSFLTLFPGLVRWTISGDETIGQRNSRNVNDTIRRLCPELNQVHLHMTSTAAVKEFVAHVFTHIKTLVFMQEALTSEVVIAILGHSRTLQHIECLPSPGTLLYDLTTPPAVITQVSSTGWMLPSIPRLCPHLESFCFPLHEIDMDDIESNAWGCTGLKELRIRIVGLNTAAQIARAIDIWLVGRRDLQLTDSKKQVPSSLMTQTSSYDPWPLESRVAAHLLKFKNLHTVWLGTKVWRV
ncbi:hypothetical protein BGZ70_000821 [Mortierella alpina]|uniref:Uncharacterized protein n=1 Tax=Mortierella alpina TaxID=64518 RepID=A0A9P6JFF3_MORAP|nr:hypothetical protein BGZ70_000821 [Mortierella alpina]